MNRKKKNFKKRLEVSNVKYKREKIKVIFAYRFDRGELRLTGENNSRMRKKDSKNAGMIRIYLNMAWKLLQKNLLSIVIFETVYRLFSSGWFQDSPMRRSTFP